MYAHVCSQDHGNLVYIHTTTAIWSFNTHRGLPTPYSGTQNTPTTSSITTQTFNTSVSPSIPPFVPSINTFLRPPIRYLYLQFAPSITYTVTKLDNTSRNANIVSPLIPSVRPYDHQYHQRDLQYVPGTINTDSQTTSASLR